MRLFISALLLVCANATPQYVKTAGVKGGYGGRGNHYHGGESLVSHNNTQNGYGGYSGPRHNHPGSINFEKGVCYIEVPTASLVHDPAHVPAGNGSRPDLSRVRSCCAGYTRNIYNYLICDPVCTNQCVNGLCIAPDTCTCFPDHVKNLAGVCIPTCPIGCQNGQCSGGECICNAGYRLDSESKFCVPICQEQCGGPGRGNCTAPNTCECRSGYSLTPGGSCRPACDRCTNGECVNSNECRCWPGYEKKPNGNCEPVCANPCRPPSTCVAPNECSNSPTTTTLSPYGQHPTHNPNTITTRDPHNPQPQYPNYPGQQPSYPGGNPQSNYPGNQQPNYPGHQQPNYPGQQQPNYPGQQQPNYPGQQQPNYLGQQQPNYPGHQQPSYPGNQQSSYPGNQPPNYPGLQPQYPGYRPSNYPGNQNPNITDNQHNNRPGTQPSNYPNQPYNPGYRPSNGPDSQPIYTNIPSNQQPLYPESQHGNPDHRPNPANQSSASPNGTSYYPNSEYYPGGQYPDHQRPNNPNTYQASNAEPYYPNSQYYPVIINPHQPHNPGSYPQGSDYQHRYPDSQAPAAEQLCSRPCINGTCIGRDMCLCNTGYLAIGSDTSRCEPYCPSCTNGTCVSPYVCVCNTGYYKDFSVKGRSSCVRRIRRSVDVTPAPINIAQLLVFEIPDY